VDALLACGGGKTNTVDALLACGGGCKTNTVSATFASSQISTL
jgi:hypothetical protein